MANSKPNRLAKEKSPYLLQHANNPVDWFPWGDEAFERARAEDKPLLVSIGYSTCHWCHVMEKESFEDEQIARLMNDAFINIKVDREERPDLDSIYMTACQLLSGSGGWPLNVLITPDGKPFFAATYIPRETRFGRLGMTDLVPRVTELWKNQRDKILSAADQVTAEIERPRGQCQSEAPGSQTLNAAFNQLEKMFDDENGGFGDAPKFPTPHNLTFLLRHHRRSGEPRPLAMVEKTLQAMRRGGIFDHLGHGFHRYSTNACWLVPHFEKMLYDQALLLEAYAEARALTGKAEYARSAREIVEYVLRDLSSPGGAFYSAEDADSEGEEGKFYVWTDAEMAAVLAPDEMKIAAAVFGVEANGNYQDESTGRVTGANILHLPRPIPDAAAELNLAEDQLRAKMEAIRQTLFVAREKRPRPLRDDKILTDWNGLMIAALAKAGRLLPEPNFTGAASRAAAFILDKMRDGEGNLLHRMRDGEAAIPGFLDDYAFMTHGLIELYQASFETRWLAEALRLNREAISRFHDGRGGGGFFLAEAKPDLITRPKDAYDGALPSGNSIMALNLLRLGRMTADPDLERLAEETINHFSCVFSQTPAGFTAMMNALDFAISPSSEAVVAGRPGADDTRRMSEAARSGFHPNRVIMFRPTGEAEPEIVKLADYLRELTGPDGGAALYLCENYRCETPVTDPAEAERKLGVASSE